MVCNDEQSAVARANLNPEFSIAYEEFCAIHLCQPALNVVKEINGGYPVRPAHNQLQKILMCAIRHVR